LGDRRLFPRCDRNAKHGEKVGTGLLQRDVTSTSIIVDTEEQARRLGAVGPIGSIKGVGRGTTDDELGTSDVWSSVPCQVVVHRQIENRRSLVPCEAAVVAGREISAKLAVDEVCPLGCSTMTRWLHEASTTSRRSGAGKGMPPRRSDAGSWATARHVVR
jgi:hypothetical protein